MLMRVSEAARLLGVSEQEVEAMINAGELPGTQMRLAPVPHWLVSSVDVSVKIAQRRAAEAMARAAEPEAAAPAVGDVPTQKARRRRAA